MIKCDTYQQCPDIHRVKGFVVNVHDSINYDIDLDLPEEVSHRYYNVIKERYRYQVNGKEETIDGTTYRCRLRGITFNTGLGYRDIQLSTVDAIKLINMADGWVECTIGDVDIYRRLLIDITIPLSSPVILKNFLLLNERLYSPYISASRNRKYISRERLSRKRS